MFCRHKWFKWSEVINSYRGHKIQFRSCSKCGKTAYRDLGYLQGSSPEEINQAIEKTGATREWRRQENDKARVNRYPKGSDRY